MNGRVVTLPEGEGNEERNVGREETRMKEGMKEGRK